MKWKRSRKAKEQATASAQSDTERLRSGGKTAKDKTDESKRAVNPDDGGIDLDMEDGEEEEEDEDEEEEEEEVEGQHGFPVAMGNGIGMPRSTDFGYNPHSPFSDEELEGVQGGGGGGGDRKIGAGLWNQKTLVWSPERYRDVTLGF